MSIQNHYNKLILFPGNLSDNNNRLIFFITVEGKETILDILQGTVKILSMSSYELATACFAVLFSFNIKSIQNDSI